LPGADDFKRGAVSNQTRGAFLVENQKLVPDQQWAGGNEIKSRETLLIKSFTRFRVKALQDIAF
jgi:hypothetical protein